MHSRAVRSAFPPSRTRARSSSAPGPDRQLAMPTTLNDRMLVAQAAPDIADRLGRDITELPFLQHLAQVMPAADVAFGGGMLLLIMIIHATGVRAVTSYVVR